MNKYLLKYIVQVHNIYHKNKNVVEIFVKNRVPLPYTFDILIY